MRVTLFIDRCRQLNVWLCFNNGYGRRFSGLALAWGARRLRFVRVREVI